MSYFRSGKSNILKTRLLKNFVGGPKSYSLAVKNYNDKYITLDIDGKQVRFNNVFLRDCSGSPKSIDSHSKQKLFSTGDISKDLILDGSPVIRNLGTQPHLRVNWKSGLLVDHSYYSKGFLEKYSEEKLCRKGNSFLKDKQLWSGKTIEDNSELQVEYHDYLNNEKVFAHVLDCLNKYGLCFINNVKDPLDDPDTQEYTTKNKLKWPVAELGLKFGYIKETFYGTLFAVVSENEALNIANTATYLPLHMDLLYYESPPGLQLLHFIRNSADGGENLFADSFAAADFVKQTDPTAYEALTQYPITFQYKNNNEHYYYSRPLVVEEAFLDSATERPCIKEVNYSPPFQGPFEIGITSNSKYAYLFEDFLRGYRLFENYLKQPENNYKVKMKESSCVIFDNRRTLHSRLEFKLGTKGKRFLMGAYIDGDSYRSKLRTHINKSI